MHKFEPLTAVVLVDNNMGIGSGSVPLPPV